MILPVQSCTEEQVKITRCVKSKINCTCCIWHQEQFAFAMNCRHSIFHSSSPSLKPSHLYHREVKQKHHLQKQQQHQQQQKQLKHHQFNAQYLLLLLLGVLLVHPICGWQENIQPKVRITSLNSQEIQRFPLSDTGNNDSLKLLEQDGSSVLIGGRNVMYNISLNSLKENKVSPKNLPFAWLRFLRF